ncbi:MAG: PP0621 family protein [Rubrivivax sp.]|jgi:uncharacterized protein|nr:hypothetical protein [Rubrivivax sp.]
MKYLVLLLVLAVAIGVMMLGRRRAKPPSARVPSPAPTPAASSPKDVQSMLACAHCGVNLPRSEVVFDAGGRPYCGHEHRLLGPAR